MNILLVDDPHGAEATKRAIGLTTASVVRSVPSVEAVRGALMDFAPDLLLSKHALPRFDAIAALRAARQIRPELPLIVMMAALDSEAVMGCLRSGAIGVVGEPPADRIGQALVATVAAWHQRTADQPADPMFRDGEERLRFLTEHLPGVVYLRRNAGHYPMLHLSEAVARLTGYPREDFLTGSVTFFGICHPRDRARCDAEISRALASHRPFDLVYRLRHRSGRWRWVEERGAGVDHEGELKYVEGFLTDVTDRRRAERRSARPEARAAAALGSLADAVIVTGRDGRIESLNPAAERLTGWRAGQAGGRLLGEVVKGLGIGPSAAAPVAIRPDGTEVVITGSAAAVRGRNGKPTGAVISFHDATAGRAAIRQLVHAATHDALTGLANRAEFERRLERAVRTARSQSASHALCYLDLDEFKRINDTAGHAGGDAILRQLGQLLAGAVRSRDTACRLGGDEFGFLLEHCSQEEARGVAEKLLRTLRGARFLCDGRRISLGLSIGVAAIGPTTRDPTQVLAEADGACYRAKRRGGNQVHVFRELDPPAGRWRRRARTRLPFDGYLVELTLATLRVRSRIAGWWQRAADWVRSRPGPRRHAPMSSGSLAGPIPHHSRTERIS